MGLIHFIYARGQPVKIYTSLHVYILKRQMSKFKIHSFFKIKTLFVGTDSAHGKVSLIN